MKISTIVLILAAIVIIAGGAWWYTQTNAPAPSTTTTTNNNPDGSDYTPATTTTDTSTTTGSTTGAEVGVSVGLGAAKTVTVTYSATEGFSPSTVTVNRGDTVKFVSSDGEMWVASAEHPTHTEYDGSSRTEHCAQGATPSFDQCSKGSSYSFTFTKTGTFDYHNHVSSSDTGSVIVK